MLSHPESGGWGRAVIVDAATFVMPPIDPIVVNKLMSSHEEDRRYMGAIFIFKM